MVIKGVRRLFLLLISFLHFFFSFPFDPLVHLCVLLVFLGWTLHLLGTLIYYILFVCQENWTYWSCGHNKLHCMVSHLLGEGWNLLLENES